MSEPAQPAPPVLVISTHLPDRWWPVAAAVLLTGCAGSAHKSTHQPSTTTATANARPATPPPLGELLAVPAVGRIYGRCALGAPRWTIKFINAATATDYLAYRIGTGPLHTVNLLDPGRSVTLRLVPGQFTSREPADPISGYPAATIKTTAPVSLIISQGTEPHIFRVNINLTLAAAIGDTTNCALISSSLNATTYYPGGPPPS